MNGLGLVQLEPFAEIAGDAYRFGYRTVGLSDYVSAVELPLQIVEQAVIPRASLTVRIVPDGTIISHMLASTVAENISNPPIEVEALDVLVQNALDAGNLRMEEATVYELATFLQRLERSIDLVKEAICQVSSEPKTGSAAAAISAL